MADTTGDLEWLKAKLADGSIVRLMHCVCSHCDNFWFVREIESREFDPRFCPYCGIQFVTTEERHA